MLIDQLCFLFLCSVERYFSCLKCFLCCFLSLSLLSYVGEGAIPPAGGAGAAGYVGGGGTGDAGYGGGGGAGAAGYVGGGGGGAAG